VDEGEVLGIGENGLGVAVGFILGAFRAEAMTAIPDDRLVLACDRMGVQVDGTGASMREWRCSI
jgi:hypothetical protein